MIVLASCQDVAEEPGQIEAVTFDPRYPSLHTVPPRPQLTYTVEQRRAIVDMLIADRANARYTEEVVRYRAGLSSEPPPAFAAVSPEPNPGAPDAAQAITPPGAPRAVPAIVPETKFRNEDDSLDSFMRDMVNGRAGSQGRADPAPASRPDANAAPPGNSELIVQAAAYPPRSQVVVLAMPPDPASLPPPHPAPPLGSLEAQDPASLGAPYKALPPPPLVSSSVSVTPRPDDPTLAGRAPGVVWGIPDMAAEPVDGPLAMLADASSDAGLPPHSALPPAETTLASRAPGAVWGMPDMAPAPTATPTIQLANVETAPRAAPMAGVSQEPAHAEPPAPARIEPRLAGRAPGVIWGMPDMAPAPAGLPAVTPATRIAEAVTAPLPGPGKPSAMPAEMVLAGQAGAPAPTTAPSPELAPPAPAPAKPARPAPAETLLAGPAPESDRPRPAAVIEARDGQTVQGDDRHAPPITIARATVLPAPAKPTPDGNATAVEPMTVALADQLTPQSGARPVGGIEITDGLVTIDVATRRARDAALGSIPFRPKSAMLAPDAVVLLAEFLNGAEAPAARIRIVGEAPAPALALDRALAVGLALVQGGVPADRLELTLAQGGSGDQARLFLAAPEL